MAIKGKTKSRSRRVVAIPPKPPVYVRKPPLWRRRGFIVSAAVVAALLALLIAMLNIRSGNRREAANAAKALKSSTLSKVSALEQQITGNFPPPPDSQASPPTGYVIYPTLSADLDSIVKGKLKPEDAVKKGKSLADSAKASADAIDAIVVTRVIPQNAITGPVAAVSGLGATRLELNDAKRMIVASFRIWESVGGLMEEAGKLTGADQKAVIDQATQLATQASSMFRDGYQKILNVKTQLTTIQPNPFPAGPPGGFGG